MIWGSAKGRDDDGQDGRDDLDGQPGAESPGESWQATEGLRDEPSVEILAGETVALFGLTDSGKTSFLYALKHAPARPARLRWSWPAASPPFAAATRAGGEALEGTRPGTFFVRPLGTLRRAWRRGPEGPRGFLGCPSRRVSLPEVAGENVQMFVGGLEASDERSRRVNECLRDLLTTANEVLFLVGVKESTVRGTLTQDSVERSLSAAASALDRCAGFMRDPAVRPKDSPVFLTFVITKRDALRRTGLAVVRARAGESLLGSLLASRGGALADLLKHPGGGDVQFDVNDVCDHPDADIAVQEAAAWDFVRCHAPKAAVTLDSLSRRHGVSLRVVTCKPFGCECRTPDGLASALPLPGQIDSAMVWESLDDLVERSYRWRARVRMQSASVVLAAAALLATAFPLADAVARSRADSHIAASRFDAARDALGAWHVRLNPWRLLTHAVSERHRYDEALRWNRLLAQMEKSVMADGDRAEVEREVAALDPTGSLVGSRIRDRNRRMLTRFVIDGSSADRPGLEEGLNAPDGLRIPDSDMKELARDIASEFRSVERDADGWRGVSDRIEELLGWVGASRGAGGPSIVVVASDGTAVPELRRGLEKQREVATFRADVAALRIPGKDLDERWLADIAAKLSRAGADELADHATRARLGDMRSEAVRSWWAAEAPADPERVVGLLAEADAWKSPEARDECTSLARGTMGVWLRGRLSALPEGDRGVVALEEHLRQAAASIAKANASLGRSGFVNADQLVAGITAVADMASVVSGLQSIDGIPVAARKLDLDAIRQSRLAARFDVGEPEELDLSAVVDRLEAEAKALLEKRVPDACMAASEPGGTAAGSSLDGIETIARRLKHTLSKQAQDLVGLVRAATSQAIDTAVVGSRACACLAGGAAPARVDQIVGALAERLKTDGRIALLRSVAGCLPQGAGQGKDGRKDLLLGLARRALVADDLRSEDVGSVVEVLEGARLGKDDLQTLVRAAVTQRLDEAGSGDDAAMQAKSAAAAEVVRGFAMGPGTDEEQLRRMVHGACAGLAGEVVKALEQGNPGGDGAAAGGAKVLRAFSRALTPDGVGSDPYLIADALDELDRHRKLALDWGLKAVKCTGEGEEAAGNGPAIRLLLAEHELGLPDLQKHLSVEAFERLPGRDRLPFEWADGKLQPKARTPLARGLLCELNLSREQAAELADALGLRLPTKKEWQCAFECVDDRGGVRSRQDAKAGDANAARDALVRMKDVSRDGIIGLVLGVREWSSDGDLPLGGCYKDAETLDEKPEKPEGGMRPVGMRPVGMRLALDPVPPLLREIADAKP